MDAGTKAKKRGMRQSHPSWSAAIAALDDIVTSGTKLVWVAPVAKARATKAGTLDDFATLPTPAKK
jgi:hypothetical protein